MKEIGSVSADGMRTDSQLNSMKWPENQIAIFEDLFDIFSRTPHVESSEFRIRRNRKKSVSSPTIELRSFADAFLETFPDDFAPQEARFGRGKITDSNRIFLPNLSRMKEKNRLIVSM